MDKSVFFREVRNGILGPTLDSEEVRGCEGILDAAAFAKLPISHVAYILGTAYHETQSEMAGKSENLNYRANALRGVFGGHRISIAQAQRYGRKKGQSANQQMIANTVYGGKWGLDNLGNTEPNDGWFFRGRGAEHVTGRANYQKVDDELCLGGKLMENPAMLDDPELAGKVIVSGMMMGRYRGHKLSHFLPNGIATISQFKPARAIINPDRSGLLVGRHALQFQRALSKASWK